MAERKEQTGRIPITMFDGTDITIPKRYAGNSAFTKKQVDTLAMGYPIRTRNAKMTGNAYVQIKKDKNDHYRLLNVSETEAKAYMNGVKYAAKYLDSNSKAEIPDLKPLTAEAEDGIRTPGE